MILLKRIFSDTNLFDEVIFEKGLNIILGNYSGQKEVTGVNGIGKSTLVRLIDYALLSDDGKKYFDTSIYNEFFKDHSYILEFYVDDDIFQIKRVFNTPNKVFFGKAGGDLTEYTDNELKDILGDKLFCNDGYKGAISSSWYRSLLKFFVKDDIDHSGRTDPINFIHQKKGKYELLKYNFFLLNLPNSNVGEFISIKDSIENKTSTKKTLISNIEEKTGKKLGEYKSEVAAIEKRVTHLEKSLNDYKFLEKYKDVENRLTELTITISQKLKKYNILTKRLSTYSKCYDFKVEVDINRIKQLYNEVNSVFADSITHQLDEVLSFRKTLTENRKRYLQEKETDTKKNIETLEKEISDIEEERSRLYKTLDENKAIDSIRNTYVQLIAEKSKIEHNVLSVNKIQEMEQIIADLEIKRSEVISGLVSDINKSERIIASLRNLYKDILENAIYVDKSIEGAYFNVMATTSKKAPVDIQVEVPKGLSLGRSRFRILSYDLLVFLSLINDNRNLPQFLIHDGVFHGIDKITIKNILNYINSKYLINPNFQYIITANLEELEIPQNMESFCGKYNFELKDAVRVEYSDTPNKMIFKHDFSKFMQTNRDQEEE